MLDESVGYKDRECVAIAFLIKDKHYSLRVRVFHIRIKESGDVKDFD